ncbi:AAA family ATPase [Luteibacter aegosomatissinici]|uniref:AAA family ATPase n=1 Tax=Luteibacter aegosomatissinici TaxID=2911539 RepID=UPI001FFA8617|nr:AAA family ATPase [Luteibacter aegosomatissinici]UPG94305.1 AAA family ATPase [Luteibacter aegosomatissinici]
MNDGITQPEQEDLEAKHFFPLEVRAQVQAGKDAVEHVLVLHSGLTILLGPNGAGKTQLMRAMKPALQELIGRKKVRFLSAGRMGLHEQYRSDYDGYRGGMLRYD